MTRKRARESEPGSETAHTAEAVSARTVASQDEAAQVRKRNEELQKANTELKCLADYRSRSLARLAHELRNPLTSILGFTEILLNHEKLTTAQEEFCRKIQNSALQIEANLSQLSDLARLEVGAATLSLGEFSLADVLPKACQWQEREARKQNVQLLWQVESDLPAIVSDLSKVRHVLHNFLAYAISRSPDGAVVNATLEKTGSDCRLEIEDDGEHLSEPFQILMTADSLRSDRRAGTGEPGVAIALKLIDVLGAKLSIRNRKPRGVVVTIQFPARPPDLEDQT